MAYFNFRRWLQQIQNPKRRQQPIRRSRPQFDPLEDRITPAFGPAMNFAVGTGPFSAVVGDFNRDGKADLAAANRGSNSVSVQLGNGAGSFTGPTNFGVDSFPNSVSVGDFNGDGNLDLATANSNSNNVSVLLGTGSGSFGAATNFGVGTGPNSATVGDFNGDGKLDLATANYNSNNVSVLLGNGAGSFSAPTHFTVGALPRSVTVGDFNRDGKLDLAAANQSSNNVSVLLGAGTGSFGAATNFAVGLAPFSVSAGDFNGDGKPDLATANKDSNNVSVLLGNGAGSFTGPTNFGVGSRPYSVTVGDFNGDGKSDLAAANRSSNNVSVLLGVGTGSFQAATNFAAGSSPSNVAAGDFNGDGKPDLAAANYGSNNVSVLLNNYAAVSSLPFQPVSNFGVGTKPDGVAMGDFNGDGKLDLAASNASTNNVSVLLGTGTGSFGAATNFAVGSTPASVTVGDFNGDGKADLAVANFFGNNVSVLLGTGSGSFGAATNFTTGSNPRSVITGDFNGDGKLDLATASGSGNSASVLLGTGTGSFGAFTNFAAGSNPRAVAMGDFNGDGKPDLATANRSSNNVSILLGTGSGSFSAATNFAVGTSPRSVAVGDFNGDGKPDLAVANRDSNNVSVLLGTGSGGFGAATNLVVGTRPYSVTVGDFNGDGKPDLVATNYNSNNVSVLLGTGAGSFSAATNIAVGTQPYSVTVGDFNGDGTPDLATANYGSNNVSVLLGNIPSGTLAASLSGGALTVTDTDGAVSNNLTVSVSGADLIITDAVNLFQSAPAGGTLSNGNKTLAIPLASVTGSLTLNGMGGNDTLTIVLSGENPIPTGNLFFNGGANGNDTLVIVGGSTTTQTFNFTNENDGSVVLAGAVAGTINYSGLEPISSSVNADNVILNYGGSSETITVSQSGAKTQVDSNIGGETVSFNNPTASLQINAGGGNDIVTVNGFGAGFGATLTINGDLGNDTVNLNADISFANGMSLDVDLQNDAANPGSDSILLGAGASIGMPAPSTGNATLRASRLISFAAASSISVGVGALSVEANQQMTPTSGDFAGVFGATVSLSSQGSNPIVIKGRGGDAGTSSTVANAGVRFTSSSTIFNSAAGAIEITGASGAGGDDAAGISLEDTTVGTTDGNVTLVGTAVSGVAGLRRAGVAIKGASGSGLTAGGTGSLSITGTGAPAPGTDNVGILVDVTSSLTVASGTTTLIGSGGQAGAVAGSGYHGIVLFGIIDSQGSGLVTLTGVAGMTNASGHHGILASASTLVSGSANVKTVDGNVILNGTGNGAGFGIDLDSSGGSVVDTTASTGNITLNADTINLTDILASGESVLRAPASNMITIQPLTAGRAINLGAADVSGPAGRLGLTDEELDRVMTSVLKVGSAVSGTITFSSAVSPANYQTLALGSNVTFTSSSEFRADVGPTAATYEKITVAGTVTIDTGAKLSVDPTGGYIFNSVDQFIFLDNDLDDGINGTFTGPTLTNFLGSTLTAAISYSAGTGNDLEIVAQNVAPTVTAVFVRGTAWDASYLTYLQANSLGSSTLGYAITDVLQLSILPWRNLNQISLVFSEDVVINGADLRVLGVRTAEYAMLTGGPGFSYNAATRTATYTLASPIINDKVRLWLNSGPTAVRDTQGAALDGEWGTNGAGGDVAPLGDTFPSGNGAAGGVFRFRLNIVPGDVNASGNVDAMDVAAIYSPFDINTTHATYRPLRDVDGNGAINLIDADFIRSRRALTLKSLPTGAPPLDPVGVMGGSSDIIVNARSAGLSAGAGAFQSITTPIGARSSTTVQSSSVVTLSTAKTPSASVMDSSRPRPAATPNVRDAFFSSDGLWF